MDKRILNIIKPSLTVTAFMQVCHYPRRVMAVSIVLLLFLSLPLAAQVGKDSIQTEEPIGIGEVTVQGHRVVNTENGQRIFPSKGQLEASATAYSLIRSLALPGIMVDEVTREIKSPDILGSVQIRINDVIATRQDLLALEMATVKSVDFIREPGLRYGKDIAYVININVVRPKSGYSVGGEIMQPLTCLRGSEGVYARFNSGKSELSLDCDFGWRDSRGAYVDKTAVYALADGMEWKASSQDIYNKDRGTEGSLRLRYSLAETGKYRFDISFKEAFSHSPESQRVREMETPMGVNGVSSATRDRYSSPQLDLYLNLHLPHKQTFTASATATYVGSRYGYSREDIDTYAYSVYGKTRSVSGEMLYENRLKPFTLSAGLQYSRDRIENVYSGDVDNSPILRQSDVYGYAQLNGRLGSLGWKAGMGLSQRSYVQGEASFHYTLPRPTVMLSYRFSPSFFMRYNYELSIHAPRVMYLSDVTTTDEVVPLPSGVVKEMSVGNPLLKPDNRNEHNMMFSYTGKKVETMVSALYLYYRKNTVMQDIVRNTLDDGTTQFLSLRRNQGSIRMLNIYDYTTLHLLADKLDIMLYGAVARFWNYGDEYTHVHTSLTYSAQVNARLGRFSLSAFAGNGWEFLEGETRARNSAMTSLSVSYRLSGAVRMALHWQNPFRRDAVASEMELLNRNLYKDIRVLSRDMGNKVTLQLSVNLSRGRKHDDAERRLKSREVDSGVVKQE